MFRLHLIVPARVGNSSKPTVIYTWEQVLEIRAIKNLRQEISLQTLRKIIELLNKYGFDDSLRDKQLVAIDQDVFWLSKDWSDFSNQMPQALKVASKRGKDIGQYTLIVIPTLIDIVNETWAAAEKSQIVALEEFSKRAKARPTNVA